MPAAEHAPTTKSHTPTIMKLLRLSLPAVCLAFLASCSPADIPKNPSEASAKVDSFKTTMTSFGEKTQATVESSKPVFTRIGEATEAGIDTTKSTLETVGTVTEQGITATKTGLEAVGNTVIEIRDGTPEQATAPKDEQAVQEYSPDQ